jgi:hypothetical protein
VNDLAAVITATAALIGAFGGIVAAILAYRSKQKAGEAKVATDQNRTEIIAVGDKVYALGERLDGPLSELMKSIRAEGVSAANAARSEGHAAGEQAQRERQAPADRDR